MEDLLGQPHTFAGDPFICLISLHEAIKQIRNAQIIKNSSYDAALNAWNTLTPSEQALYTLSAKSIIAA